MDMGLGDAGRQSSARLLGTKSFDGVLIHQNGDKCRITVQSWRKIRPKRGNRRLNSNYPSVYSARLSLFANRNNDFTQQAQRQRSNVCTKGALLIERKDSLESKST